MIAARFFAAALLASALCAGSTPACADKNQMIVMYMSGDQLTKTCREYLVLARNSYKGVGQTLFDAGTCQGYVMAVLDTMWMYPEIVEQGEFGIPPSCVPRELKTGAATEIVAQYVDRRPEERDATGYVLVRRALAHAFPCRSR